MVRRWMIAAQVLAVVLALLPSGIGGAQSDLALRLVPFVDENMGITGLRPEGWQKTDAGTFSSPDLGTLVQQAWPLAEREQALAGWLADFPLLDAPPDPAGVYQGEYLTWTLYYLPQEAPDGAVTLTPLATAQTEARFHTIGLMPEAAHFRYLHDAVLLPALDAYREGTGLAIPTDAPSDVALVPFSTAQAAAAVPPMAGLRPAGWRTMVPGTYLRENPEPSGLFSLQVQTVLPGQTLNELTAGLIQQLIATYGLPELPQPIVYPTERMNWVVVRLENVQADYGQSALYFALGRLDGITFRVELRVPAEPSGMYEAVFLPALQAFHLAWVADPVSIALLPHVAADLGWRGLVPAGWDQIQPGVFMSPQHPNVGLAYNLSDEPPAAALAAYVAALGLPEPTFAGTLEAGGRTWTRYQARVVLEGVNKPIVIEVAMASQNGAGTLLVMLQAREALFEAYATTVLLPALEQFAPLQ